MTAVAPQNRGDNMGRYSVAGSGLDCKSSGFTSPGSSPGRLTSFADVWVGTVTAYDKLKTQYLRRSAMDRAPLTALLAAAGSWITRRINPQLVRLTRENGWLNEMGVPLWEKPIPIWTNDGIGRLGSLKNFCFGVPVQVWLWAPKFEIFVNLMYNIFTK